VDHAVWMQQQLFAVLGSRATSKLIHCLPQLFACF
jgi:hypothetical protein